MRGVLYTLSIILVVALAFWAYDEGYETRATERAVAQLKREIGQRHQELSMLNAEWAYLNRPDRLAALAEMNFETLGLMPLSAEHFATIDQVAYPLPEPVAPQPPEAWAVGEALSDKLGEVIVMTHRYGADTAPRLIAPPTLAEDGEQLP